MNQGSCPTTLMVRLPLPFILWNQALACLSRMSACWDSHMGQFGSVAARPCFPSNGSSMFHAALKRFDQLMFGSVRMVRLPVFPRISLNPSTPVDALTSFRGLLIYRHVIWMFRVPCPWCAHKTGTGMAFTEVACGIIPVTRSAPILTIGYSAVSLRRTGYRSLSVRGEIALHAARCLLPRAWIWS